MDDAARIAELEAQLAASREETRHAFENRALIYGAIFDELSWEIGDERATDIMQRAIRARGHEVGKKYRPAVRRGDLEEVGRIFCEGSPVRRRAVHARRRGAAPRTASCCAWSRARSGTPGPPRTALPSRSTASA